MIIARQLTKHFGKQSVLQSLSFSAEPGKLTLLLGVNGAGKTTTLRILSGLARPDSGDAVISGHSIVTDRVRAQSHLSSLPQTVAFHPRLSCEAILLFYARLRGIDFARVRPLLERVGLGSHARKPTGQLSGGLRQRLGLCVLLLPDAPVLLLDEPGLSLDPEWRNQLQGLLQLEARAGKTVLVTTHLLGEWEGVADRALMIGREGSVREINPCALREAFHGTHPVSSNTHALAA